MSEIILAVIECSTNMSCIWCICAQGILFQPSLGAVLTQSYLFCTHVWFVLLQLQISPLKLLWVGFQLGSL